MAGGERAAAARDGMGGARVEEAEKGERPETLSPCTSSSASPCCTPARAARESSTTPSTRRPEGEVESSPRLRPAPLTS